jgi:hypothetical protein
MGALRSPDYRRYCIDRDFLGTVSGSPHKAWEQHYLEYILVTGANWAGPIGQVRLIVDKGSPDNLVSFCGRGVRKISPTQFEMRASRFVPTSNLAILILTPSHSEEAVGADADLRTDMAGLSCNQLFYRRNSLFNAAGYCFRTPRAIRVFGNAGCRYDNEFDVPLSDRDRQVMTTIREVERIKRCPQ